MDEEEPTRKTSLRRFLRGSDKNKNSPSKSSKSGADAYSVASSSSYPTTGANSQQLKNVASGSAQATPNATPPHKPKHHFGLLLRRDLHLNHFFNRHNQNNSRRFSPPVNEQNVSPLAAEAVSPSPAEAELSRALNQLNSVTRFESEFYWFILFRSGRLASSSSSGGFHPHLLEVGMGRGHARRESFLYKLEDRDVLPVTSGGSFRQALFLSQKILLNFFTF